MDGRDYLSTEVLLLLRTDRTRNDVSHMLSRSAWHPKVFLNGFNLKLKTPTLHSVFPTYHLEDPYYSKEEMIGSCRRTKKVLLPGYSWNGFRKYWDLRKFILLKFLKISENSRRNYLDLHPDLYVYIREILTRKDSTTSILDAR